MKIHVMRLALVASMLPAIGSVNAQSASAPSSSGGAAGRAVYEQRCAACHANPQGTRAPTLQSLQRMSAQTLRYTLTQGVMQPQASGMAAADLDALISFLAAPANPNLAWAEKMRCTADRAAVDVNAVPISASFGIDPKSHRRLSAQQAGLTTKDMARLEVKWALGFPDVTALRSQIAVVGSTLFLAVGQSARVYALDADTGCVKWTYVSETPLRTSITFAALGKSGRKALLVGGEDARLHAIDARSGERIWVRDVRVFDRSRTTAAPLVHGDRIIVALSNAEASRAANDNFECCRTHGAVVALDANTGERLWVAHTTEGAILQGVNATGVPRWGPSGAPIWATPTIDVQRNLVYVATGENFSLPATKTSDAILAIDLDSGAIKWSFQGTPRDAWNSSCGTERSGANCPPEEESIREDWDFGGSVVLTKTSGGKDILLAGQKSGHVWALDPDADGKLLWSRRIGYGTTLGGVHWGVAVDDTRVFVPINDSVRPNRFSKDPMPGLYALSIDDGSMLWSFRAEPDCSPKRAQHAKQCGNFYGLSSPPLVVDSAVVTSSVDGKLRIFDAASGKLLFSDDTIRAFKTINGVAGHGGQIDNGAFIAANGTLFVQSGYGSTPGNVLIAYRPNGRSSAREMSARRSRRANQLIE
jgi:polyvinyl alcohol dehydrogenase (cytochrome)